MFKYLEQQLLFSIKNSLYKYLIDEGWHQMYSLVDFCKVWNYYAEDIVLKIHIEKDDIYGYKMIKDKEYG